jgi:uncharacterized protein
MRKKLDRDELIRTLRNEMPRLRKEFGVSRLALYGSFARDMAQEESDVDILIELEQPLGLRFVTLADELEKSLDRKVDIATFASWRRSFSHPRYRAIAQNVERDLIYV